MNISRFLLGAVVLGALPTLAQPEIKPTNGLPYPVVTPEEAAKIGQGNSIKLHLRDVTVKEALEEVERQTGLSIETDFAGENIPKQKLSLDIETTSFREVTEAILDEAGVKAWLQNFGRGNRWILNQGEDPRQNNDAPQSGKGPFQMRLQSISATQNKSVQLGKTPTRTQSVNLNASFMFDIDPLIPLAGAPRLEMTRVEDDQGRSLLAGEPMPFFDGNFDYTSQLRLRTPEKDARQIAHFEGKSTFVLAAKRETWEVADVLNAKDAGHEFVAGNNRVRFAVVSARKTSNIDIQVDVSVNALTPGQDGFQTMRHPLLQFNQLASSIRLVDAEGKKLGSSGFGGSSGGSQLTGQLRFVLARPFVAPIPGPDGQPPVQPAAPTIAEPVKLIIDAPTELVQTQVPFSFSDIPLP